MLDGTVMDVAPLPDPTSFFSSDIKVYTTKVKIDQPLPGLQARHERGGRDPGRPQDNVLTVPVLAVLQFNGKDHVTKKVDDRFVQTEVELGVSNEKYRRRSPKGLKEGDVVAMNPMSLMTEEEKREAFGSASKGGKQRLGRGQAAPRPTPRAQPAVLRRGGRRSPAFRQGRRRRQGRRCRPRAKASGKGGKAKGKGGRRRQSPWPEVQEPQSREEMRTALDRQRRREERRSSRRPA